MSKVKFKDYHDGTVDESEVYVDKELQRLEISYDGGRFNIYINGKAVYNNSIAGDDFNFTINVED